LNFVVNFSEVVNVANTPRLTLTVGSLTKYADYLSGSGSTAITFRYTVAGGDFDNDSITMSNSIDLNTSGTISDSAGNSAVLGFVAPTLVGVYIDGIAPQLNSVTGPSANTYKVGDNLDFTANFSESVTVGSIPRLTLTIGADTKYATYLSGSTTTALVFRYTVASPDSDSDGISVGTLIELYSSSTIKDSAGNSTSLNFAAPSLTAVLVDAVSPTVATMGGPSAGTYKIGDYLIFTATFSETVAVTNTPRLALTVGSLAKYADYLSGGGSAVLSFRYTVGSGDVDTDNIAVGTTIDLNGSGTIKDTIGNSATLTYTAPSLVGVLVDGIVPFVTAMNVPANAYYTVGSNLDFTTTFSETVSVTNTPRLVLTIGSTTQYANYLSGSGSTILTFRYTVANPDLDIDGIAVASSIDLNGVGVINDVIGNAGNLALSVPSLTGVLVDTVAPSLPGSFDDGQASVLLSQTPWLTWTYSSSTDIAKYQIAIGSTVGATNILNWTDVTGGSNANSIVETVSLSDSNAADTINIYYASIRVVDLAGNISSQSNGDGWNVIQWQRDTRILSSGAGSFGQKVMLSENGNVLAVASPNCTHNSTSQAGCVDLYVYNATAGSYEQKVNLIAEYYSGGSTTTDYAVNDYFGSELSITELASGPLPLKVVVGVASKASGDGRVYIAHCSFATNPASITCASENREMLDMVSTGSTLGGAVGFGQSVSVSRGTLVIGAPSKDFDTNGDTTEEVDAGVIYNFVTSATNAFGYDHVIYSSVGGANYQFGNKVLLKNSRLLVTDNTNSGGNIYSVAVTAGSLNASLVTALNTTQIKQLAVVDNNAFAYLDMSSGSGSLIVHDWDSINFNTVANTPIQTVDFKSMSLSVVNGITYLIGGSDRCSNNGGTNYPADYRGCLHFYKKTGAGSWVHKDTQYSSGTAVYGNQFGYSVTSGGNYLMVGAPGSNQTFWFH
jgi:hypothetical protein